MQNQSLSFPDPVPVNRTVIDFGIIFSSQNHWILEIWSFKSELWLSLEKAGKNLQKIQISLYINGVFHTRFLLSQRFSWRLDLLKPGSYLLRAGREQIYKFQIQP